MWIKTTTDRLFCDDLDTLHASQSPDEYHHGASLFIEKWKRKEEKVCAWFDAEYFGWRQTFFASRTPAGLPATNDPHENFNKLLKEDGTARERLSCGGFLKCMKEELRHQSHPDEMGGPFPTCFDLSYDHWRNAQEWVKAVDSDLIFQNQTKQKFCVPSTVYLQKKPTKQNAREEHQRWNQKLTPIKGETFDLYFARCNKFYNLAILKQSDIVSPYVLLSCTCPMFWKHAHCKHSIGVGIQRGLIRVPANFSSGVIGSAGKRGRKPLAKNVCYGTSAQTSKRNKNN